MYLFNIYLLRGFFLCQVSLSQKVEETLQEMNQSRKWDVFKDLNGEICSSGIMKNSVKKPFCLDTAF